MVSFLLPFVVIIIFSFVDADILEERNMISSQDDEHSFIPTEVENIVENKDIEESLRKMEDILAEKSRSEGVLSAEHVDKLNKMTEILLDITEKLKEKANAYKFLNAKGFDKIIMAVIEMNYRPLQKQTLILTITLFTVAPTITKAFIPINFLDKLLDIFENDESPAMKAHALDIMHKWLPNSPKVQVHVMKLKGLEPFYDQILKLDRIGIHTLMELFNEIVEEHKKARSDKSEKSKEDYERMQLYQRIGLLERMSTAQVCNGLVNILDTIMSFTKRGELLPASVLALTKNMQQFCVNNYKGKDVATMVIDELYKYVTNWHNTDLLINAGLDPTEIRTAVEDLYNHVDDSGETRFEL